MMRPTKDHLSRLVGQRLFDLVLKHNIPLSEKGKFGHAVEAELGISLNSAQSPDLADGWELKATATVVRSASRKLKETIAVSMINPEALVATPFEHSHVYKKLRRAVYVFFDYHTTVVHKVFEAELTDAQLALLRDDYEFIRSLYRSDPSRVSGRVGRYLQARTKGPGGNAPKTRAFYLRPRFFSDVLGIRFEDGV